MNNQPQPQDATLRAMTELAINNRLNCRPRGFRPPRDRPREAQFQAPEPEADLVQDQDLALVLQAGPPPRLVRQFAVDLAEFVDPEDKENNESTGTTHGQTFGDFTLWASARRT
jgi:hypothetical protein